jgi:hypothetical protein
LRVPKQICLGALRVPKQIRLGALRAPKQICHPDRSVA